MSHVLQHKKSIQKGENQSDRLCRRRHRNIPSHANNANDNDKNFDNDESDVGFKSEDLEDYSFFQDIRSNSDDWVMSTDTEHDEDVGDSSDVTTVPSHNVPVEASSESRLEIRETIRKGVSTTSNPTSGGRKRSRVKYDGNSAPKRPLSAYNIFFQRERQVILKEYQIQQQQQQEEEKRQTSDESQQVETNQNDSKTKTAKKGTISFQELGKMIGQRWQSLPKLEKKELQKLATLDGLRYRDEMDNYERIRRQKISDVCRGDVQTTSSTPLTEAAYHESTHTGDRIQQENTMSLSEFMANRRLENESCTNTETGGIESVASIKSHRGVVIADHETTGPMTSVADAIINHNRNEATAARTSSFSSRDNSNPSQLHRISHPHDATALKPNDDNDLRSDRPHDTVFHHSQPPHYYFAAENDARLSSSYPSMPHAAQRNSFMTSSTSSSHHLQAATQHMAPSTLVRHHPNHRIHPSYAHNYQSSKMNNDPESYYYQREPTTIPSSLHQQGTFQSSSQHSYAMPGQYHHHHSFDMSLSSLPHSREVQTEPRASPNQFNPFDNDFNPAQTQGSPFAAITATTTTITASTSLTIVNTKHSRRHSFEGGLNREVSHDNDYNNDNDLIHESQSHETRCAPISFWENVKDALPMNSVELDQTSVPLQSRLLLQSSVMEHPKTETPFTTKLSTAIQHRRIHSCNDIDTMMKVRIPDSTGTQRSYHINYKYYMLSQSDANYFIKRLHECHQTFAAKMSIEKESSDNETTTPHYDDMS